MDSDAFISLNVYNMFINEQVLKDNHKAKLFVVTIKNWDQMITFEDTSESIFGESNLNLFWTTHGFGQIIR